MRDCRAFLRLQDAMELNQEAHQGNITQGSITTVLKVQIGGYDIGRVFMDACSGINLIYAQTLKAMSIPLEWLKQQIALFMG
jgi:hypothetical protein